MGGESASTSRSGSNGNEAGSFECNICFELPQDPIVTLCGHLFCWPCIYRWLHGHSQSQECPVCKAQIEEDKLVPLYGRGKTSTDPRSRSVPGINIPNRPSGQRPPTAPPPDPNQFPQTNPWFMGNGIPVGGMRFGNYTFSAMIGGMFPFLGFHMHGFHDPGAYGPAPAAYTSHFGYPNTFHGAQHAQGFPSNNMSQGQQADYYLKTLLTIVAALVVVTLLWF